MLHDQHERPDDSPDAAKPSRRLFLARVGRLAAGALGLAWSLPGSPRASAASAAPDTAPIDLLERSPYVYISPLLRTGRESSCHAELWFAWMDDSVVVTVAKDRWKAAALALGLNEARVWVGDHGRWQTMLGGRNEDFRSAPHFVARAEKIADSTLIERLLAIYAKKYPDEIERWRDKMRSGIADGSRIMIRYTPNPPAGQ